MTPQAATYDVGYIVPNRAGWGFLFVVGDRLHLIPTKDFDHARGQLRVCLDAMDDALKNVIEDLRDQI